MVATKKKHHDKFYRLGYTALDPPLHHLSKKCDKDSRIGLLYAMPQKKAQALEAEYDAILGDPSSTHPDIATASMDEHAMEVLLEQVEFVGYKAEDLDELRGHFHHMDGDESGSVDVDEFFAYIKEPRSSCSEWIFQFHGQNLGANDIKAEFLDFAIFVKA